MVFEQSFIEKVLSHSNLVEIISQNVQLKEKGGRLWGCCPFPDHSEKTASFSVQPDRQLYYCFGCKRGGNTFQFVQTYFGYSFPEAVEYLAKRSGLEIPKKPTKALDTTTSSSNRSNDKDHLLKINKASAQYFHQKLMKLSPQHPAVLYIQKRQISAEVVDKFKLGIDESWQDLTDYLKSKKVNLYEAEALNLVANSKNHPGKFYDFFRERIIFPILTPLGDVVGFGGRAYGQAEPKYLNSRETVLFHKGSHLYGLNETAKYIRNQQSIILVEGYMDCVSLYDAGIRNVAAILGTALTPDHAKLIKKYSAQVTLLLDGDDAGQNATEKSLSILLQAGLFPKVVSLPDGLDPDDYLKKNSTEALLELINGAQDLFLWVLGRWMKDYRGSHTDKVLLLKKLTPVLAIVPNKQLQDLYIVELSRRLDLDIQWVRKSLQENYKSLQNSQSLLNRNAPKTQNAVSISKVAEKAPVHTEIGSLQPELISLKDAPKDEIGLIALVLCSEEFLIEAISQDLSQQFSHDGTRQLLNEISTKYRQDTKSFAKLAAWVSIKIEDPKILGTVLQTTLTLIPEDEDSSNFGTNPAFDSSALRGLMNEHLRTIKRRYLKNQATLLVNQLREIPTNEQLEHFMNVHRKRLSLEKP